MDEALAEGQLTARALAAALRMLGQREHSEQEVRSKLSRKLPEIADRQIDAVVVELVENGWLSDTRYAESLIRRRLSRGYGAHYILRELSSKGIDADTAEDCLEASAPDWHALARDLVERRHPDAARSLSSWERAARFLQRRGFGADVVVRALGERPRHSD